MLFRSLVSSHGKLQSIIILMLQGKAIHSTVQIGCYIFVVLKCACIFLHLILYKYVWASKYAFYKMCQALKLS